MKKIYLTGLVLLSGCAAKIPETVATRLEVQRTPTISDATMAAARGAARQSAESGLQVGQTPSAMNTVVSSVKAASNNAAEVPGAADITLNFEQMALPAFVQVVYGSVLKKNVSIDAQVAARTDLVTFRATRPQTAAQVANLTRQLLKSYGVSVQDYDGLVRVVPDNATTGYLPQIRRGRAQPEVPTQLRPIFHLIELDVVRTNDVTQWLRTMFGAKIQALDDGARNAILISGQPEDVTAAIEVAQVLDQPVLRGSRSVRLTPTYWAAEEFAKRLSDVMTAQGFSVAMTPNANPPLLIMPIAALNTVIAFSGNENVLAQVTKWAKELDRPASGNGGGGMFTYAVKHADATDLARVMGEVLGGNASATALAGTVQASNPIGAIAGTASAAATTATKAPVSIAAAGGVRIVVNSATNTLIIQGGKPEDFRQWMQILAELDRPTRSALIEVVVAEIKLSNTQSSGIEWLLNDVSKFGGTLSGGTLGGLGTPTSGGFNLRFLNGAGAVRSLLNLLATDSNSRILSSPKVMARNGETATIQVGQEVPVISSTQSGLLNGGVVQSVQYKTTGVILKVKPVIHSSQRLDLEVSQEVSSAATTTTGVTSSPTISTRKVDTKLTLRDGAPVVLAGLISSSGSISESGVPLAKDVPYFGNLFKQKTDTGDRTELVIMITPYVINDEYEAESISDSFRNTLGSWTQSVLPRGNNLRAQSPTAATVPGSPTRTPIAGSGGPAATEMPVLEARDPEPVATPAPAPAPVPSPTKREADEGDIQMSTPTGGIVRPLANPAPTPGGLAPASSGAGTGAAAAPAVPTVPLPNGGQGRAVTDPKLLKELEDFLKKPGK